MLMLLRRKRLLVVYMGCMAAACLLAYNLLPPVNHDNVPRLRMLQENSANDSTADLTLLLDQIDEHLQQVRAQISSQGPFTNRDSLPPFVLFTNFTRQARPRPLPQSANVIQNVFGFYEPSYSTSIQSLLND